MKLFYSPGACSFSPHVLLLELGIPFELVKVERDKKTSDGRDFMKLNPKGYVPAIELDNGKIMTEGVAITQYLADQKPESKLAPKLGTMERYELMEMMNFITTELHKGFSPLFGADGIVKNAEGKAELIESTKKSLAKRFSYVDEILAKQPYLMGNQMTIADIYLLTVLRWTFFMKIDLAPWPALSAFVSKMQDRPSVQKAIKAEGLKG